MVTSIPVTHGIHPTRCLLCKKGKRAIGLVCTSCYRVLKEREKYYSRIPWRMKKIYGGLL